MLGGILRTVVQAQEQHSGMYSTNRSIPKEHDPDSYNRDAEIPDRCIAGTTWDRTLRTIVVL